MTDHITAAMVARGRSLASPRFSPDGSQLAWIEMAAGRSNVVVAPSDGTGPPVVATGDTECASTHVYGGGVFEWVGDDALVVARSKGGLDIVPAVGGPARMLVPEGRCSSPAVSSAGDRIAYAIDLEKTCEIAVVSIDGGDATRISSGADFTRDPTWSPDGRSVVWHEWDVPAMPWDESRLVRRTMKGLTAHGPIEDIAAEPNVSYATPRFSPDGRWLAYLSDEGGWFRVWVARADGGNPRLLVDEPFEHGLPTWGVGARSFAWSPDGTAIAYARNELGFGRLVVAPLDGSGARDVARAWHLGLDWSAAGIAAVRSGGKTPLQIVIANPEPEPDVEPGSAPAPKRRVVARGPVGGFEAAALVEPEPITWTGADGAIVHGLLSIPRRAAAQADTPDADTGPAGPLPLVVDIHGGPTGGALVDWQPSVALVVDRGYAVLRPNYRGSTGYGREYTQALNEQWGVLDVDDVIAGITSLIERGIADPRRVAVVGGSAGGFTALLVAERAPELVTAVASSYGVTDLRAFASATHRFEAHYLDRLVGDPKRHAKRYVERSPLTHAATMKASVLVLQGDADVVVPLAQATALVDALRISTADVEYHVYEGAGHGWSTSEATVRDEMTRIEALLARAFDVEGDE